MALAGCLAALVAVGWGYLFGGVRLGRVDPLFSLPGRVLAAASIAIFVARRPARSAIAAAAAMLGLSLLLDIALAKALAVRIGWGQMGVALVVQSAVLAAALAAMRPRPAGPRPAANYGRSALIVAIAALMLAIAAALAIPLLYGGWHDDERPELALMAGVPIDWQGPADMAAILSGRAQPSPVSQALARDYTIRRLDTLDAVSLRGAKVMLLAHPKALAPADLVALDDWLRGGGRALILADGLLSWPPAYALGDTRNPPVTSLLTPLLDHWGLDLVAPADDGSDLFVADGQRVLAVSSGRFTTSAAHCRISLDGRRADCTLGKGRAILIADADLLDPGLWSDGRPGAAFWRQGNMGWILKMIDDLSAIRARGAFAPVWIRPQN